MNKPPEHRTLFAIDLGAERARKRVEAPKRGRSAGAGATSDVRRHRPMLVACAAALVGVLVGWRVAPAASTSRGALALPHRSAKLSCASCHAEERPSEAASAAACKGCHGEHPSMRAGHRALASAGKLTCIRCHDVHGADEGVRFVAPNGEALRYGVGATAEVAGVALPSEHDVTVPLIPVARCAGGCHQPSEATDPIARCLSANAHLNLCFDEHQSWSAVEPPRAGGVCAAQHGNDRFAAWDAARQVAAVAPAPAAVSLPSAARWWLLSGAVAGLFGALVYAGAARWRSRSRTVVSAAAKPADRVRLPQIDTNTCLGCYACVDACPYDVLTIERYVAQVERPELCCGLTLCEQVCPNGSLVITDGDPIGNRPRVDEDLQALDAPGVYLAGDVTGLPLIKNAIRQGSTVIETIAGSLPAHDAPLDVVIVGAGPAGISAALKAKEIGLRYAIIEQGSVAQSIRSFPRGKLVFDQPLELPITGKLWLAESTKEELLSKWMRVVREEKIEVRESTRFVDVTRDGATLTVGAQNVDTGASLNLRAARLVLAIGVRGTPRKLPIAIGASCESKVFYHLADARGFVDQRVMVVGLGDVAMECAIALAHQPGCTVTVVYRGADFSRGKTRNIAEVKRLVEAGRVQMCFESDVVAVSAEQVTLQQGSTEKVVPNDVLFVMIGSEAPKALLEKAGVEVSAAL